MTRLTDRIHSRTGLDVTDTAELRDRILDLVEQVVDRAEHVIDEAPSPSEAAKRVRRSRAVDAASGAVAAAVPLGMELVRSRRMRQLTRKHSPKALVVVKAAPKVARVHPMLSGLAIAATVTGGALAVRRRLKARALDRDVQAVDLAIRDSAKEYAEGAETRRFDLDEEVARMGAEGGPASSGRAPRSHVRSQG